MIGIFYSSYHIFLICLFQIIIHLALSKDLSENQFYPDDAIIVEMKSDPSHMMHILQSG